MEKFYPNLDLKFLASCPVCECQYDPKEIKILDKKDGAVTLYFACAHCKNSVISLVNAGVLGVTAVSMITDLNISEAKKVKEIPNINYDDILIMYDFFIDNNLRKIKNLTIQQLNRQTEKKRQSFNRQVAK